MSRTALSTDKNSRHLTSCSLDENPNIENLKLQRDELREDALSTKSEDSWRLYRSVRNALKVEIRNASKIFMENALSSRNPRDVWKIIHRILKPNTKPLRVDLESLNEHFVTTAQRTTGCHATEENFLR